jgi:hypothetical protein
MDLQIIAVPEMEPRLLTRSKIKRYLANLQVLSELTCLGRPSRERDDLMFSDV